MGNPTERTVTDANAQRTHLTRWRTQTIAQGTKGGLQDLWKQPRAQPETLLYCCVFQQYKRYITRQQCFNGKTQIRAQNRNNTRHYHTRTRATALQYPANSPTKASLLRHKKCITALVTQQYTATQQVYTRVHTIYTTTQLSTQSTSIPITRYAPRVQWYSTTTVL